MESSSSSIKLPEGFVLDGQESDSQASSVNLPKGFVLDSSNDKGFSLKKTITNIPSSGLEMGKGIYQAVRHPLDTGEALGSVALGGVEKLIPGQQKSEQSFDALTNFFKNRYGGIENIKKTIQDDPVGFLADISTVFSGGGAAATKLGNVSKLGGLVKAGELASRVGELSEPVNIAIKAGKLGGKLAGEGLAVGAGLTTGGQVGNARQALNPTKEFMSAMRGKTTEADIVKLAQEGLQELKDERAANYTKQLGKVGSNTKKIDLTPIKSEFQQQLKKFNVRQVVGEDGKTVFDFSRSPINKSAQNDIAEIAKDIEGWGTQVGDDTAAGLDILKRKLDDFYTDSNQARSLVTGMKNKVKGTIIKEVPDYEKLVKDYETASKTLNDIRDELSLGKNAKAGTSVRKLQAALRQPFGFREKMVDKLEQAGATGLKSMIAGNQMNPLTARGIQGALSGGGLAYGMWSHQVLNPAFWAGMGLTSPRLMAETLAGLGMGGNAIGKILGKAYNRPAAQATFQAGRVKRETEK